jgi:type I restriction enzyme S subunit
MELRVGFKDTDIGAIPEDWNAVRVDSIGQVKGGKRLPLGRSLTTRRTPYPYLRVSDMKNGTVDVDSVLFVPEDAFSAIKNYRISRDDLYISVAGTLGLVGIVPDCLSGANLTENADKICNISCDRDYLYYCLIAERIQNEIASKRTVGAQPKLAIQQIEAFLIALPRSEGEQRAIAAALSDADALIASLEALIAKKRDLKRAAMQQLLTGKARLPGFAGKWEAKLLGDHVRFLRNGTLSRAQLHPDAPVKYLHYGDIHGATGLWLRPSFAEMPMVEPKAVEALDRLTDGDLIFADASEDLDGVGKSIEIADCNGIEVVSGLHTIAARFDKDVLADGFKAYLQSMPPFREHLRSMAAGTKVLATNRKHVASAIIELPAPAEQIAIAAVLSDMDAELSCLEAQAAKARALKQGMMQELLTGRVRLV